MTNKIEVEIKKFIPGYKVGDVVTVATDKEGTPVSFFWRRKLKDARIDDCCAVVKPKKAKMAFEDAKPMMEEGK